MFDANREVLSMPFVCPWYVQIHDAPCIHTPDRRTSPLVVSGPRQRQSQREQSQQEEEDRAGDDTTAGLQSVLESPSHVTANPKTATQTTLPRCPTPAATYRLRSTACHQARCSAHWRACRPQSSRRRLRAMPTATPHSCAHCAIRPSLLNANTPQPHSLRHDVAQRPLLPQ